MTARFRSRTEWSLTACAVLALSLSACASGDDDGDAAPSPVETTSAAAPAPGVEVTRNSIDLDADGELQRDPDAIASTTSSRSEGARNPEAGEELYVRVACQVAQGEVTYSVLRRDTVVANGTTDCEAEQEVILTGFRAETSEPVRFDLATTSPVVLFELISADSVDAEG
ncbi:MAG: hypothetical protein Q4G34_03980 [Micrococcus sp.]|nr:hypothetical protein [Micrococcus sp.]